MAGGGGGGQPTKSEVTQTNIPEYARPYVETMLGAGQQQIFNYETDPETGEMTPTGIKPYQPFSQDPNAYFAGFSPMQQQSFQNAANMQVTPETGMGSALAGAAGMGALNTQYNPMMASCVRVAKDCLSSLTQLAKHVTHLFAVWHCWFFWWAVRCVHNSCGQTSIATHIFRQLVKLLRCSVRQRVCCTRRQSTASKTQRSQRACGSRSTPYSLRHGSAWRKRRGKRFIHGGGGISQSS